MFNAIREKSNALGATIYEINGVVDHIHTAVSIPPRLAVADWVRQVKGFSTRQVNAFGPDAADRFAWQAGYSVLTFGKKALPFVCAYIVKQKEHHAHNTLDPYLERIEADPL